MKLFYLQLLVVTIGYPTMLAQEELATMGVHASRPLGQPTPDASIYGHTSGR